MTDPETKLTDTGFAQVNEGDSFIILSSGGDKTLLAASEQTVAGIINGINESDDCMVTKVLNIKNTLFDNNMFSLVMAADEVFKTGKTPSLWDRIKGKYVDIFGVRGKDNNEPDSFNVPTHEKYAPGGKVTPFSYKLGS
ncbi:MAG: hypothetical protein PHD48_01500 [Alphaproteobacteria bacterium]|nr:hypothetical protein [Alphaproteobacteria bacterium]